MVRSFPCSTTDMDQKLSGHLKWVVEGDIHWTGRHGSFNKEGHGQAYISRQLSRLSKWQVSINSAPRILLSPLLIWTVVLLCFRASTKFPRRCISRSGTHRSKTWVHLLIGWHTNINIGHPRYWLKVSLHSSAYLLISIEHQYWSSTTKILLKSEPAFIQAEKPAAPALCRLAKREPAAILPPGMWSGESTLPPGMGYDEKHLCQT